MRLWLHVLLIMTALSSYALEKIPLDPSAENVCLTEERFNVTVEVDEEYWYQYRVTEWCMSIPPRCSRIKGRWGTRKVPKVVEHKRPIVHCCDGYTAQGRGCKPSCPEPCRHGTCARPNVCYCFPGFRGPLCRDICKRGTWGGNCAQKCECQNDAYCNPMNGVCVCSPGWRGARCNDTCQNGYFGYECRRPCFCDGFPCHHITGECFYPSTESSTEEITSTESSTEGTTSTYFPTTTENMYANSDYLIDLTSTTAYLEMQNLEEMTSTSPYPSTEEITIFEPSTEILSTTEPSLTTPQQHDYEIFSSTELWNESSTTSDPFTTEEDVTSYRTTPAMTQITAKSDDASMVSTTTESVAVFETSLGYENVTDDTVQSNSSSVLSESDGGAPPYEDSVMPQDVAGLIVTIVFSAFGSIVLLLAAAGIAVARRRKPPPVAPPISTDIGLYRFYAEDIIPVKTVMVNPTYGYSETDVGMDTPVEAFNTFRTGDNRFQTELRELLEAEYDHPQSAGRGTPVLYDHLYDEINLPPGAAALNPKYF